MSQVKLGEDYIDRIVIAIKTNFTLSFTNSGLHVASYL